MRTFKHANYLPLTIFFLILLAGLAPTAESAQWVKTGGTATSELDVQCLVYSAHHPAFGDGPLLLAGTRGRGIWLSTDGNDWELAGLDGATIRALAFAPDGTIYAGEGDAYLARYPRLGVHRSTDVRHWELKNNGLKSQYSDNSMYGLAVNSQGIIYAATAWDGLYQSTDRGENWQRLNPGVEAIWAVMIDEQDRLFVGSMGLQVSTLDELAPDGSRTLNWSALPVFSPLAMMIHAPGTPCYYAGVDLHTVIEKQVFYRSLDGGKTWEGRPVDGEPSFQGMDPVYPGVCALALRPAGDLFAVIKTEQKTNQLVYRSTDQGTSWQSASAGLTDTPINCLVAAGNTLYAGTAGQGFYRSTELVPVELASFTAE